MNDSKFEYCVLAKQDDIIEHEKNLYLSFKNTYPEYSRMFFKEFPDQRLVSNTAYEHQKIYAAKQNNRIVVVLSIIFDLTNDFEVEQMGFKIDKNIHCVEALHFYARHNKISFEIMIETWRNLFEFLKSDLKKMNINMIYSSCSKKLLNIYKYSGWQVLEKKEIFNDTEYLLLYTW